MAYLTPDRLRAMGLGFDLDDVTDASLRASINRASAMVDAYCAVPMLPQKHDFRGGVVKQEQHRWRLPENVFEWGSRRFYPWHIPMQTIQLFRIYVTNTQYVEIQASELYIQQSANYAEVVSLALTGVGLFNALIIPNVGLATPTAVMDYTYGYLFAETGGTLDSIDGKTYIADNGFWAAAPVPVVYLNGVAQTSGYRVVYDVGEVIFDANLAADDIVTADYSYTLPPAIAQATAVITAQQIAEAQLRAIGMGALSSINIEELQLRRSFGHSGVSSIAQVSDEAKVLLEPFIFISAGGGGTGWGTT